MGTSPTLTILMQNVFVKTMETKGFFQFEIIINVLALCASFKYRSMGEKGAPLSDLKMTENTIH